MMTLIKNEEYVKALEERVETLDKMVQDLIKALSTAQKPVIFVAENEDKMAEIKKFLEQNTVSLM